MWQKPVVDPQNCFSDEILWSGEILFEAGIIPKFHARMYNMEIFEVWRAFHSDLATSGFTASDGKRILLMMMRHQDGIASTVRSSLLYRF